MGMRRAIAGLFWVALLLYASVMIAHLRFVGPVEPEWLRPLEVAALASGAAYLLVRMWNRPSGRR